MNARMIGRWLAVGAVGLAFGASPAISTAATKHRTTHHKKKKKKRRHKRPSGSPTYGGPTYGGPTY
ncbi:MAG: hypothetical protein E6G56_01950 [Actinobacteria bacterium]|nr:MAG: hypothetical protein E6G56_01950 [Actinomycetota bacterium]